MRGTILLVALGLLAAQARAGAPVPGGVAGGGSPPPQAHPGKKRPANPADAPSARAADPQRAKLKPRLGVARRLLQQGNNVGAVTAFRRHAEAHPDAPAAHVGLGKALARVGQCEEALDHLAPWEGTTPFGADAALAAAGCASRLGLADEAVRYDLLAVELDPTSARALTNLALDADTAGDTVARAQALAGLADLPPGTVGPWYADAVMALRAGDLDTFDVVAAGWEREHGAGGSLRTLRARAWLDLGDPVSAYQVLRQVPIFRGGSIARLLHGETERRLGHPDAAADLLDMDAEEPFDAADADAVRARVAVDRGDLGGAADWLLGLDPDDPEVLASRWYLARAQGDAAETERLARAYQGHRPDGLRALDTLVPLVATDRGGAP